MRQRIIIFSGLVVAALALAAAAVAGTVTATATVSGAGSLSPHEQRHCKRSRTRSTARIVGRLRPPLTSG
jgi:hypothetical protein